MSFRNAVKVSLMAVLALGWSFSATAIDEDLSLKISGVVYFGQGSTDKKVDARESDGSAGEAKAEKAKLTAMSESMISLTYESAPFIFNTRMNLRTAHGSEVSDMSYGYVLWEVNPDFTFKVGNIDPDESNSRSYSSGTGTFGMTDQGYAYHGLYARINRVKGVEFRWEFKNFQTVALGIYTEDVYYSGMVSDDYSDQVRDGMVAAKASHTFLVDAGFCTSGGAVTDLGQTVGITTAQCAVAAGTISAVDGDIAILDNADTDHKGYAWHLGYSGMPMANPRLEVTAAYVNSVGDKGDGGPVNVSTGQQLSFDMDVLKNLQVIVDYASAHRTAQTGIKLNNFKAGEEMNVEHDITETALQLAYKGLGPGKLIATFGYTNFTFNAYGEEVENNSGKTTDLDFVYDMALSENKMAGMRIALLTKKTEYNDSNMDPVNNRFIGVGLYSDF
jgi:hypothetical protein